MHDRELIISETFGDTLTLFETFKPQKVHEFNEVLYEKHEVLHGKGEALWTIQILHG